MLTPEQYAKERAICDKAAAYRNEHATFSRSGWSSMSSALASHPDYAACTNDIRGRVEEFELHRDRPEAFSAYVAESTREQRDQTNMVALRRRNVTTWTGLVIGAVTYTGAWHRNNFGGRWRPIVVRTAWGQRYHGREYDSMQLVNLRRYKAES